MESEIILVTGSSGFLGKKVVNLLVNKYQKQVRILVRKTSKIPKEWNTRIMDDITEVETMDDKQRVQVFYFDSLWDKEMIYKALQNVSVVIHCAAHSSDWGSWSTFYNANVKGTEVLLQCIEQYIYERNKSKKQHSIDNETHHEQQSLSNPFKRFVHISTTDVYGYSKSASQVLNIQERGEEDLHEESLPYNRSKVMAERLVWKYSKHFPTTIIRPSNIFGPDDDKFVYEICEMISSGVVPMISMGNAHTGFVYVDSCADAIIQSYQSPNTIGKAYTVHGDYQETLKDIVAVFAKEMNRKPYYIPLPYIISYYLAFFLEIIYLIIGFVCCGFINLGKPLITRHAVNIVGKDQNFPIDNAKKDFNYSPGISFNDAVKNAAQWYMKVKKSKKKAD